MDPHELGQRPEPDCGELAGGVSQGFLGICRLVLGQQPINRLGTEQPMDHEQKLIEAVALVEGVAILGRYVSSRQHR
jgi:hypothetical protein